MKDKQLAQICKIMRKYHLKLEDVERYAAQKPEFRSLVKKFPLGDEFDILCLIGGKTQRVPFSQRYCGIAVGIFPFKYDPIYIELTEVEGKKHSDRDVDEKRLLDVEFCERLNEVRHQLNKYLVALKAPIIEGDYLADSDHMKGSGWVIFFGESMVLSDYYGGSEVSKLRYMGRLY